MRTERQSPVQTAERLYPPPSDLEDSEQQTIWYNPTDRDVTLTLHVETPRPTPGFKPRTLDERRGTKTYVFRAKNERSLSSTFDRQVQQTQCRHVECLQRPFDCKSTAEGHEKLIVGGWGPQLENRGTQRVRLEPGFIRLAPELDDVVAREKAAEAAEFAAYQRQKMAEREQAKAKADRERAEADARAREESAEHERLKTEAAAKAADLVEERVRGHKKNTQ